MGANESLCYRVVTHQRVTHESRLVDRGGARWPPRSRHIMPRHHASFAQVIGAVGAMCAAGGATYHVINVAKVFGGAREG